MHNKNVVTLEDVTKIYNQGQKNEFPALKQVNFSMQAHEVVGLVGASGSGKSTLMNLLGFLDCCTEGRYYFQGRDVSDLTADQLARIRNKKIGFVFQSFFLLPRLTALENVMLPLFYRGDAPDIAKEKALSQLATLGLKAQAMHRPDELSGGQQQRVAIARALVGGPELILADEPTGALDAKTGDEVMSILLNLNRQHGCAVLLITHDLKLSKQCQRIVNIKDGHIQA